VGPIPASNAQPDRNRPPRADTSCGTRASLVLIRRPHRNHLLLEAWNRLRRPYLPLRIRDHRPCGFFVSGGLLFLHLNPGRDWTNKANFQPFGKYPVHAVTYFLACGFLLVAAFAPPDAVSSFSTKSTGVQWYIVPVIGISTLAWGVIWWLGLQVMSWKWQRTLEVTRVANIVADADDEGQYIQVAEVVDHAWLVRKPPSLSSSNEGHEMT
jgi:hypothetical protein